MAGSERYTKTGAEGTVAKEAMHINKSLTFLEQVSLLASPLVDFTTICHNLSFPAFVDWSICMTLHESLRCMTSSHRNYECFSSQVEVTTAGDHSLIKEECKACALSLFQANTLLEGLYWRQLPDPAGGLYLVRGEPSYISSAP